MYNIGFVHNKLGKTDGVSLEVDKWKEVLEDLGHNVFYCAGNEDRDDIFVIPELSFENPLTNKILHNSTVKFEDYDNNELLKKDIFKQAQTIKDKLINFIKNYNIDILIPNNLLSVGYNIPAMIALFEIIKEEKIPTINHNHDFYFEDSGEVHPTKDLVLKLLDKYSAPDFPWVRNLVINKLAQKELKKRTGIEAKIVPNVFDFTQNVWEEDNYNKDFRKEIGLKANDLMFLQATRILDRKGVETAIEVIAELEKDKNRAKLLGKLYNGQEFNAESRIVLVCSGYVEEFGITGSYYNNLRKKAKELQVDLIFVGDRVEHSRRIKDNEKIYSLWDSYVEADFVTYPSLWEGWGNQLIEAIFAKKPVVIFEYPVYKSDLKEVGFDLVSLGDEITGYDKRGLVKLPDKAIENSVDEIIKLLKNDQKRKKVIQKNYEIAQYNYSFKVLNDMIKEILDDLKVN